MAVGRIYDPIVGTTRRDVIGELVAIVSRRRSPRYTHRRADVEMVYELRAS